MSRAEARRRLQEADPNLTIVYGRRFPYALRKERVPKLLSAEEAEWLGLGDMFPVIPSDQVLHIEGKWSKPALQNLCWSFGVDYRGMDKQAMVEILLWAGVLDEDGDRTEKEPKPRE